MPIEKTLDVAIPLDFAIDWIWQCLRLLAYGQNQAGEGTKEDGWMPVGLLRTIEKIEKFGVKGAMVDINGDKLLIRVAYLTDEADGGIIV